MILKSFRESYHQCPAAHVDHGGHGGHGGHVAHADHAISADSTIRTRNIVLRFFDRKE
jgi:hypothetical protein